jgi:nitrite reductase/ring-hydroxylating ferredoxin subunit/DMSO/TMAO reductase YedYZ heme-binding membrane subunit
MSVAFRAVQWNRRKFVYDGVLTTGVAVYFLAFMVAGRWWLSPGGDPATWEDLRIRASGTCAFFMLSLILTIGPLARLDRRFLPLLYNRRHFGVLTFIVAFMHGWLNIDWFVSRGMWSNFVASLTNLPHYASMTSFPYDMLGIVGLFVLFLMAATSHDFWLELLTPAAWKTLHMAVYVVYGTLVMHVALGAMQTRHGPLIPILLGAAAMSVASLHLIAGWHEWRVDRGTISGEDGWITVGPPLSIPNGGARIVAARGGERIAVFRDANRLGAVSNLCAHQNGPLGEGRIINGFITCPWHGYQYRLEDGCAPPPFRDRLVTYRVRINAGVVQVNPRPLQPGARTALVTAA